MVYSRVGASTAVTTPNTVTPTGHGPYCEKGAGHYYSASGRVVVPQTTPPLPLLQGVRLRVTRGRGTSRAGRHFLSHRGSQSWSRGLSRDGGLDPVRGSSQFVETKGGVACAPPGDECWFTGICIYRGCYGDTPMSILT